MKQVNVLENGKVEVTDSTGGISVFPSMREYEAYKKVSAASMESYRQSGLVEMSGKLLRVMIEREEARNK